MAKVERRTEKQWKVFFDRQRRWRHNSFLGHCAMGKIHMHYIQGADSTTPRSKQLAAQINTLLYELAQSLKERVDG